MQTEVVRKIKKKQEIRPERVMALGFLIIIVIGTLLLRIPAATVRQGGLPLFDSFFTATSAVCVTGLVAVDTGTTFTWLGQGILLALIQVGGLGFMVFATQILGLLGRSFSLRDRMILR